MLISQNVCKRREVSVGGLVSVVAACHMPRQGADRGGGGADHCPDRMLLAPNRVANFVAPVCHFRGYLRTRSANAAGELASALSYMHTGQMHNQVNAPAAYMAQNDVVPRRN